MSKFSDWLMGRDLAEPEPQAQADALTAAAFNLTDPPTMADQYGQRLVDTLVNGQDSGTDQQAWHYFNTLAELHYLVSYASNALSQVRLFVGKLDGSDPDNPVSLPDNHPASNLLRNFAGGTQGQSELLSRLGLHLTVTGDSVIIGPNNENAAATQLYPFNDWRAYSTNEVSSRNGKIYLADPNYREVQVPYDVSAIRIYRSHPQYWWKADSPVKSAFGVLNELELLDKHVRATAISRLAGAGLLVLPEELTLPGGEVETEGLETDPFVRVLTEVMSLAIKNRDSAAALVPIILRGPAEFLEKIQRIDFSTAFDDRIEELRNAALRRIALGLDAPPEILLGSEQSSSWSMWQVSESYLRIHIKPLAHLITSAITAGWLAPELEKAGVDATGIVIWPDLSGLRVAMDPSADAKALYDENLIDGAAYRHLLGFGEEEAPTPKELEYQILLQLLKTNPQLAPYALKALKDDFGIPFPSVDEALTLGLDGSSEPSGPVALPDTRKPAAPGSAPVIPGQRSRDKQSSAPPKSALNSPDPNNNEVT